VKRGVALLVTAAALALVPLPAAMVERWYSRGVYPPLQDALTRASNLVPVALLDLAVGTLIVVALAGLWRVAGWRARLRWLLARLVVTAAIVYILFVALWGLNYRREPLEDKVAFDRSRITREALVRLANDAVARANARYQAAHALAPDAASLERALDEALAALGGSRPVRAGVPKMSTLSAFFRRAAVDGMTDPWFLEVILNPDLLHVERPVVLAHEWAHLAGYADEAEANFVAWLACLRGDALAQYSASLATYEHATAALSRDDRRSLPPLDAGPREDVRAIAERYRRASPLVREASREMYDSYLKANRVEEGIAAYGAVIRLMLGTEFVSEGVPRLRPR
jgi:Protein of unknown function (DUF3810)